MADQTQPTTDAHCIRRYLCLYLTVISVCLRYLASGYAAPPAGGAAAAAVIADSASNRLPPSTIHHRTGHS
jgi:hypothetical protein